MSPFDSFLLEAENYTKNIKQRQSSEEKAFQENIKSNFYPSTFR
jgi:hypothetical protein